MSSSSQALRGVIAFGLVSIFVMSQPIFAEDLACMQGHLIRDALNRPRCYMSYKSDQEAEPRDGHTWRTLIAARISGCANQKELSLEDQEDRGREISNEIYSGETEFDVVATTGKGERLDRPELAAIERKLETGNYDLFVMDDVGRLVRGHHAVSLWGTAVDNGTRCVAPIDDLDTISEGWERDLLQACGEHVGHNILASRRIKQKSMNRFIKYGHTAARPIASYIVPQGARSYDDWRIDEAISLLIRQAASVLRRTLNCSGVADWFNERGVKPGLCCRSKLWNGPMVRRFFGNTLLKGKPQRGKYHTVKHHKRGRRISVKNPKGPAFYDAPHLAILEAAEFDDLNEALATQNFKLGRPQGNGDSGYSPRRSKYPSGSARCWYCGFHYVWGAHGQVDHLQCNATREWHCWNSVGLDGALLTQRIVEEIIRELEALEGFEAQFAVMVEEAQRDQLRGGDHQRRELDIEAGKLQIERANLEGSLREFGPRKMIASLIDDLEDRERQLLQKRTRLERSARRPDKLPGSPGELMQLFQEQIEGLAQDSYDFADVLRQIVTSCHVYLVQLVDGGHLEPRAKVTLSLGAVADGLGAMPGVTQLLTRDLTIDVFAPPQRERIRLDVVRLAGEHPDWTQRQIAAAIREQPEQTVVWRALKLDRQMRELGLSSPYVLVMEPPADSAKLRRQRHSRYEFRPLAGYVRKALD